MSRHAKISDHLIHAGAGTSLVNAWLSVTPGFIPTLALTVLIAAVLVVPAVILALAAGLLATPPYLLRSLATRPRRRRRRQKRAPLLLRASPVAKTPTP